MAIVAVTTAVAINSVRGDDLTYHCRPEPSTENDGLTLLPFPLGIDNARSSIFSTFLMNFHRYFQASLDNLACQIYHLIDRVTPFLPVICPSLNLTWVFKRLSWQDQSRTIYLLANHVKSRQWPTYLWLGICQCRWSQCSQWPMLTQPEVKLSGGCFEVL